MLQFVSLCKATMSNLPIRISMCFGAAMLSLSVQAELLSEDRVFVAVNADPAEGEYKVGPSLDPFEGIGDLEGQNPRTLGFDVASPWARLAGGTLGVGDAVGAALVDDQQFVEMGRASGSIVLLGGSLVESPDVSYLRNINRAIAAEQDTFRIEFVSETASPLFGEQSRSVTFGLSGTNDVIEVSFIEDEF